MGTASQRIRERTLARKAAGLIPDYATHSKEIIKLSIYTPCENEGNVLERCHTCNGEAKHVRECDHEENPTGKCTRGHVSDKVWSCSQCSYHSSRPSTL